MFCTRLLSAIALFVLFCRPDLSYADAGLLRTIQPLDEARGYCLDIRGASAPMHKVESAAGRSAMSCAAISGGIPLRAAGQIKRAGRFRPAPSCFR
ncbi:MAG TPA: hypothetical protein VFU28_15215 [Vicinamibacterales bacterium]|nr:hypothetical protein [Vicinamibacterales bacterium]